MSPEFYAIIGSAVGLASLIVGLSGVAFFLISQNSKRMDRLDSRMDRLESRMDRLENRMDRLEDRMERMENRLVESIDLLRQAVHSLDKRVAKLEWMFEAEFGRRNSPPGPAEEEV